MSDSLHDLVAQAKSRLVNRNSDNEEWFLQLSESLQDRPRNVDTEALVDGYITCMEFFYTRGEYSLAIHLGEIALALAKSKSLLRQARRLANMLGAFFLEADYAGKAVTYLTYSLQLAKELGDPVGECRAWANLAKAARVGGQAEEAITYARRALAIAGPLGGVGDVRMQANQIIAAACLQLHRLGPGLLAISNALAEMPNDRTPHNLIQITRVRVCEARLLTRAGRFSDAQKAIDISRELATESGNKEVMILARIAEVEIQGLNGQPDEAIRTLKAMLADWSEFKLLREFIVGAMAYIYEKNGQIEEANHQRHLLHNYDQRRRIEAVSKQIERLDFENRDAPQHDREEARRKTIETLAIVGELHDDTTGEHCFRVGSLASLIAKRIGWNDEEAMQLDLAARLHDIGKIAIADAVLMKPGELLPFEVEEMRKHVTIGFDILRDIDHPLMRMSAEIARYHHEWWDGNGYPDKLSGEQIPLAARITAVADVFDALTHARVYKEKWPMERAISEISSMRGRQFDPAIVDAFMGLVSSLIASHGESGLDDMLGSNARENELVAARSQLTAEIARSVA
jgi:putative two-component system response regulator